VIMCPCSTRQCTLGSSGPVCNRACTPPDAESGCRPGLLPSDMMHTDVMIRDDGELQQNLEVLQPPGYCHRGCLGQERVSFASYSC
jgi:hypothetical protein